MAKKINEHSFEDFEGGHGKTEPELLLRLLPSLPPFSSRKQWAGNGLLTLAFALTSEAKKKY